MIRWGILGLGNIAKRFMQGLAYFDDASLYAIASYTAKKREEFVYEHPDVIAYDNYHALLDDKNIDAVYIAMRHNDHYQWAKEALMKGKAVLCEKPATLSLNQTQELCYLAIQNHTFFMEAMKTRFIPLIDDIKKELDSGVIGDILNIETYFCSDVPYQPQHYLFDEKQGGALYDVGIYNVASTLDYIHSPLVKVRANCKKNYGVDVHDVFHLTFENGQKARIEIAIDEKKAKKMVITGTKGKLIAEPFYRPVQATIITDEQRVIEKPYMNDNDFYGEIAEVHRCLKEHLIESERMSFQDSILCMKVIEDMKESCA